ncbi:MAG: GFA family protein, partial [Deltaproteobacteria bacterium]|nr:GFA family protein [Deltaproteobacteria bacterium]
FIDDKPAYYAFTGERTRMTGAQVMAAFGTDPDR